MRAERERAARQEMDPGLPGYDKGVSCCVVLLAGSLVPTEETRRRDALDRLDAAEVVGEDIVGERAGRARPRRRGAARRRILSRRLRKSLRSKARDHTKQVSMLSESASAK